MLADLAEILAKLWTPALMHLTAVMSFGLGVAKAQLTRFAHSHELAVGTTLLHHRVLGNTV